MGTLLADTIIASVRLTLRDPLPGITWTDEDLLRFFNEGERYACQLRPDLYTTRGPIPMVPGTLQELPAGGSVLIRLDQNVTGGKRCRLVDSSLLDASSLAWPASTASAVVDEYCCDPHDRRRFHVRPPNDGTGSVVAHYGTSPPPVLDGADPINLDDAYELVIKHAILAEAYSFDTPRQDFTKADYYRKSVANMLGINAGGVAKVQPKYGATPGGA